MARDTQSSLLTAGLETAKGGLAGFALTGLATAALAVTGAGAVGSIAGGTFAGTAGAILNSTAGIIVTIVTGLFGAVTFGTVPALIGSLFGLARGANKISRDKATNDEIEATVNGVAQKQQIQKETNREIQGMNTYYTMGVRDTEARIGEQIPEMLQAAYIKGGQDMKEQIEKTAPMPRPKEHAHAHAHPHPKDHPVAPVAENTGAGGDWSPAPAERSTGGGGDWTNHVAPKSISPAAIKEAAEKAANAEVKRG